MTQSAPAQRHGRDVIRRVKTATVTRGPGFPHAIQAVQIMRRRRIVTTAKVTSESGYAVTGLERGYAVTGLTAEQADAPEIAHRVREHRASRRRSTTTPQTGVDDQRETGERVHVSPLTWDFKVAEAHLTGTIAVLVTAS